MSLPVSRRALLSAVFPFSSSDGESAPRPDQEQQLRLVATVSSGKCVEGHGVVCRRCAEVCEPSAVRIIARGGLGASIDNAACTGCGDCVPICPVEAITLVARERAELASEFARLVVENG